MDVAIRRWALAAAAASAVANRVAFIHRVCGLQETADRLVVVEDLLRDRQDRGTRRASSAKPSAAGSGAQV